jgi:hypothetical protein
MAVEDVLQVAMLLLPSGSIGLVCSCRVVWSATVYGGRGCALPHGCSIVALCLRLSLLSLTGLVVFAMVRHRWCTRPLWWMTRLVERYELPGYVVFFWVGRNPYHLGTDAVTLASVDIPS